MKRPIDRYVDSLVLRRRPKPFAPTEDDVAVARVAVELAAAAPEAQRPREAFVEDLRRRLADQQNVGNTAPEQVPAHRRQGRRGFLAATGMGLQAAGILQQATSFETPDARIYGFFGLLVVVRTFVSLSLVVEIEGRWPWQRPGAGQTSSVT